MNKRQREIIVDAYEGYIRNGMRCDPVGGFGDLGDMFTELQKTDEKLKSEMQERYDEIPEK